MSSLSSKLINLKIKTKLLSAFSVMVILMLVGTAIGAGGASKMVDYLQTFFDDRFDHIIELSEMQRVMAEVRADVFQVTITSDASERSALWDATNKKYEQISGLMVLCDKHCQRTNATKAYQGMEGAWFAFKSSSQNVFEAAQKGASQEQLISMLTPFNAAYQDLSDRAWGMSKAQDRLGRQLHAAALDVYELIRLSGILSAVASLVIAALFVWGLTRQVVMPLQSMTLAMKSISQHDLDTDIPGIGRGDEIGAMAEAVKVFKDSVHKADQFASQQETIRVEKENREKLVEKLTLQFDDDVNEVIHIVTASATKMDSTASEMSLTAEQTEDVSNQASSISDQAAANVETVASAAEELSASISEISRQVAQSTQIANNAVQEVDDANQQVQGLADAANKIGEVVSLITDIADQTNLLALNATIEAARAGEAGKGFAVVASEVKNLANQTAKATEEISAQIGGIQGATQDAVQAIGSIGSIINEINEIASSIASAVEEQGAATQEIARNVEEASAGTTQVSKNVSNVTLKAKETGQAAAVVKDVSHELSVQTEKLKNIVQNFLSEVRDA